MSLKLVPCPNCGRVFHIKSHKQVDCICQKTFDVLRGNRKITLVETKTIKTRPFMGRKIGGR